MKRIAISVFLFALIAGGANAAGIDDFNDLTKLGLSEAEIRQVTDIELESEQAKKQAQLELNILKAQLEKLLADPDPDMKQVEKLLRDSVEWKVKSELAEINKRVQVRKILGEGKWKKLVNFLQKKTAAKDDETGAQKDKKADKPKAKN
jgi:hypothetical protein